MPAELSEHAFWSGKSSISTSQEGKYIPQGDGATSFEYDDATGENAVTQWFVSNYPVDETEMATLDE